MTDPIAAIRGRLIVSVQAYPGEPMHDPRTMAQIAEACVQGGAAAIRAQGLADLGLIRERVRSPLIGLWKDGEQGVYITPTVRHAQAVADTGCDVVAMDATRRPRPDGRSFAQTVAALRESHPQTLVMADCGSLDDALAAQDAGADLIGSTLAGYTGERPKTDGPDFDLIEQMVARLTAPVVVEGRVHTLAQAQQAMSLGVHAVCVGTAITHPSSLTRWFCEAVDSSRARS